MFVTCNMFIVIDILIRAFLTIPRRFPTTFRRFPKILKNLSKGHKNAAEHFPKTSEDFQRFPKTFEEDPKMFRSYTNELKNNLRDKLYSSEIIDIRSSDDMKNTPLEFRM